MPERMLGNLLRRVELARLLARPGGKLADQVFVGIAQRVDVGGELRQPFGDLLDDRAELGVAVVVFLAELVRAEIDLREQALEGALERLVLDVFEALLQRVEQFAVLRAGQVGDAGPEVVRLDDVVHLAAHLLLELGHVVGVVGIPEASGTRRPSPLEPRDNPAPVPSSPPPRSCPRGSAGTGTTACSRGSRPRSSPRAVGRRCSRGSCPVVFGLGRS